MGQKEVSPADWPAFDAPLLRDVAAAFLRRRKALRHKAGLNCEREFSETVAGTFERLNVDLVGLLGVQLRLSVWADGVMWLRVCVKGKGRNSGWSFADSFHGDMRDVSAAALVGMVEATLPLPFGTDVSAEREQLRRIWARVSPRSG